MSTEILKHTPGPWCVDRNDPYVVTTADDVSVIADPTGNQLPFDEQRGNAALIAAAPELLAALRGTLDKWVSHANSGDGGNWDPEEEPHVIAARAAIAKAEGRMQEEGHG